MTACVANIGDMFARPVLTGQIIGLFRTTVASFDQL